MIEKKICPICGNDVGCTLNSSCWCFSVDVPLKVREYLSIEYEDCICKECLLELIDNICGKI